MRLVLHARHMGSQVSGHMVGAGPVPKLNCMDQCFKCNIPYSTCFRMINICKSLMRFQMGAPLTRNRIFILLVHKNVAETGIDDLKKVAEQMKECFMMKQTVTWSLGRNTNMNGRVISEWNLIFLFCGETLCQRQELLLEKEHSLVRKTIKKQEQRSKQHLHRKHLSFYISSHIGIMHCNWVIWSILPQIVRLKGAFKWPEIHKKWAKVHSVPWLMILSIL